jgi:hypothetical protein
MDLLLWNVPSTIVSRNDRLPSFAVLHCSALAPFPSRLITHHTTSLSSFAMHASEYLTHICHPFLFSHTSILLLYYLVYCRSGKRIVTP